MFRVCADHHRVSIVSCAAPRTLSRPLPLFRQAPLWKKLLGRVLFSAASYEMLGGALVDGIVFRQAGAGKKGKGKSGMYIEEVGGPAGPCLLCKHLQLH